MMEIKSERLLLRNLKEDDLGFMYDMDCNRLVYLYEEEEEPGKDYVYEKYNSRIIRMAQEPIKYLILLIEKLPEKTPVGQIHIQLNWEKTREWEIGYTLHPDYWGSGYATEAAKLLLRHTFVNLNAHKVMAFCNADNKKSAYVMERIGMKREGIAREARLLRNKWFDEYTYSILDREYFNISV